ncbi:MAG: hypothetical protein ACJA2S_005426 [Cyclobacteriaceae bacterium]|jgi:hypothetical protein
MHGKPSDKLSLIEFEKHLLACLPVIFGLVDDWIVYVDSMRELLMAIL